MFLCVSDRGPVCEAGAGWGCVPGAVLASCPLLSVVLGVPGRCWDTRSGLGFSYCFCVSGQGPFCTQSIVEFHGLLELRLRIFGIHGWVAVVGAIVVLFAGVAKHTVAIVCLEAPVSSHIASGTFIARVWSGGSGPKTCCAFSASCSALLFS